MVHRFLSTCTMTERSRKCSVGVVDHFQGQLEEDKDLPATIAWIKTLLWMLEATHFETVHILQPTIQGAVKDMRNAGISITAVVSGSELFSRFITLGKFDDKTVEECKEIMLDRGDIFLRRLLESRNIIARHAVQFITDGCRVLTHSRSKNVLEALKFASKSNKTFEVFVTQAGPGSSGSKMIEDLRMADIDCTLILDSAIGYIMESVDMVMIGAEAVVESGGIINRIGSFTMALCAQEMKKPFYVLAESFKFTRLFPLNQRDLPKDYKYPHSSNEKKQSKVHPEADYTPPAYITLLFTDLGILTPSAISDELIKLYL